MLWGSKSVLFFRTLKFLDVGWLCFTSHRQRGHLETVPPFTVPIEKLVFHTIPTGNGTPGRRVAIHYTTVAPRQLPLKQPKLHNSLYCLGSLRAASHYTISVVRRIKSDAICHDGSSQGIVANDCDTLRLFRIVTDRIIKCITDRKRVDSESARHN